MVANSGDSALTINVLAVEVERQRDHETGEHHRPAQARNQAGPAAGAHVGCRSRRAARVHEPHDQRDGAEQAAPEGHLKALRTIEMAREDASDAPHEGGEHHGEDCAAMLLRVLLVMVEIQDESIG